MIPTDIGKVLGMLSVQISYKAANQKLQEVTETAA
jgi:hypothetical protein